MEEKSIKEIIDEFDKNVPDIKEKETKFDDSFMSVYRFIRDTIRELRKIDLKK